MTPAAYDETPVYRLRGVSRIFPGSPPVAAVDNCDLVVTSGEFVSIVGTSGSGKSTLLNLLGLIDAPTSGSLVVNGIETVGLRDSQATYLRSTVIGFVFQAFHLLPMRSATDNVCLPMVYQHIPISKRRARAIQALERVGLSHRAEALPSTLSGGEAQRVAVARAVASEPKVLLCDEPTGNLDSKSSGQVIDLLEELNADGLTVILVTHDQGIAGRAARTLTVSDGQVREGLSLS